MIWEIGVKKKKIILKGFFVCVLPAYMCVHRMCVYIVCVHPVCAWCRLRRPGEVVGPPGTGVI